MLTRSSSTFQRTSLRPTNLAIMPPAPSRGGKGAATAAAAFNSGLPSADTCDALATLPGVQITVNLTSSEHLAQVVPASTEPRARVLKGEHAWMHQSKFTAEGRHARTRCFLKIHDDLSQLQLFDADVSRQKAMFDIDDLEGGLSRGARARVGFAFTARPLQA